MIEVNQPEHLGSQGGKRKTFINNMTKVRGLYHNIPGKRKTFINNMTKVRGLYHNIPWIIRGDFNMIKSLNKKRGRVRGVDADLEMFGDTINEQRLVDITTTNGIHTWNNRRGGRRQITSRLDRFLILEEIVSRDIFMEAMILPGMGSDDWPVRLEIELKSSPKK